uniref:RING-type E3 ubiquitin transferase n=1 Tax=Nelumbo nucifera TaxID=4432 RepID=A0A1U7ZJU8_NELNU
MQTYDRPFIQKWLKDGNLICPKSKEIISQSVLIPNLLVQDIISEWCKNQGIKLPDPAQDSDEEGITQVAIQHFESLLDAILSNNLSGQKRAAKEFRRLTKRETSFRILFGRIPHAIDQLLMPITSGRASFVPDLQEDVITTVLNLSIHDSNKKLVAETPKAIPLLVESLMSGTIDTRRNAAAALFTLSALDSNKVLIGKSGALKPLIKLVDEGHPLAMKDAASAIFTLCFTFENRARTVDDGAVEVILKKIMERILVDELLAILAMLSSNQKAVKEMADHGAVPCLLSIIKETSSGHNKENCVVILYSICFSDRTKCKEIRADENAHGTMSQIAQNGTPRAKRKANGILERLNRVAINTHTA